MKRRWQPSGRPVEFEFEGEVVSAHQGETLASALMSTGRISLSRSIKYHRPRGPFCMGLGGCSQCLLRVDGAPNVFSCRAAVRAGMRVERQNAYPSGELDVLGALDWIFPKGIDHHSFFAGVPVAEKVMAMVARQLAGLGAFPKAPAVDTSPLKTVRTEVLVVGAGSAGRAAAGVLEKAGCDFRISERNPQAEGLSAEPLFSNTEAFGFYSDAGGAFVAAVQRQGDASALVKMYARKFLFCLGGHPRLAPFPNNDLPGIFAGRALQKLVCSDGLVPDGPVALWGAAEECVAVQRSLEEAGLESAIVVSTDMNGSADASAHGRGRLSAFSFRQGNTSIQRVLCQTLGICLPAAPNFELAVQAGAQVYFSEDEGCFCLHVDGRGRTGAKSIYAAGAGVRPMNDDAAAQSGAEAARQLLEDRIG